MFLYSNIQLSEKEIKKAHQVTIATKKMKCLGENLSKEVKDLYNENCIALMKEHEEDTNK